MLFLFLLAAAGLAGLQAAEDRPGRKWTTIERIDPAHLQAVHEARLAFAKDRKTPQTAGVYNDYKAVLHVHAEDAAHTGGTRAGVLEAAKKTGVQVVLLSDHRGPKPETWRGLREGVLFLPGAEDGSDLRVSAFDAQGRRAPTNDFRFICHVEERYEISGDGFAGLEIYNRHTDEKDEIDFQNHLKQIVGDPDKWRELVRNFKQYPDEFFSAGADYWPRVFQKWDEELEQRKFTGVAANDAHENQVFNGIKFDPYEVSFQNVSTHILARELNEEAIKKSLSLGHAYVSHDWLCDPSGFSFAAINNLGLFNMGDTIPTSGSTRLVVQTPIPARVKFFHHGKVLREETGSRVTFSVKEPGAYRVEAWLTVDGEERPWVYSNPIYLRPMSLEDLPIPSGAADPNVAVIKDLPYATGEPVDEAKHKLDLYKPREGAKLPILFFIHGGAWKSGDRSQYGPIGNRFAKEGLLVAIPSYRLAPKNPHPAQIDDAAAALAWTWKHAAEHGGDTNRLFVAGHSAGGHLAALLTLDSKYLERHGLSAALIRGTIPLSGVFDVFDAEGRDSKVFGSDPAAQKDASPIRHIQKPAPPFLVSYCEWDYFPLAAQAREFARQLEEKGVKVETIFEEGQNHISEVLALLKPRDPVAEAMIRFLKEK